jgi:hypothetical protein
VLIGANNSGKTSLLAPLLLLKQTLRSTDPSNSALISQGAFFSAGWFGDLIHHHDVKRELTLSIRFRRTTQSQGPLEPLGSYPPGSMELVFSPSEDPNVITLERYQIRDLHDRLLIRRRRKESGRYSLSMSGQSSLKSKRGEKGTEVDRIIRKAIERAYPDHFLFGSPAVISQAVNTLSGSVKGTRSVGIPASAFLYLGAVEWVATHIRDLLGAISYVGPIRERPRRLYEVSGYLPPDVGVRGQFAPEIIHRHASKQFRDMISDWLRNFDLPSDIQCEALSDGAFCMKLRRSGRAPWVNVADLGFGISQLLPLIVQGFYGNRDSLLIAEQPEIHLNPRLQSGLADLFAAVATSGRGVLIETHSEHLLLRLRALVAKGAINSRDVALYYVEKDHDVSMVRPVTIRSDGHIEGSDWPAGFFEDSLRDSLELATWQTEGQSRAR